MSSITKFNSVFSDIEDILSIFAAAPILGTPVAACKFALGTTQTITALALGILSLPFRFCSDDAAAFNDHCWTHVVHGLGNIAASLVEAIPLLSFGLACLRLKGRPDNTPDPEHQAKYIPYTDVVKADISQQQRGTFLSYTNYLYTNTRDPAFLSPTHFRQATGFNAIRV
jgi:hypothetical protein